MGEKSVEERIQRLEDIHEIQNLMSKLSKYSKYTVRPDAKITYIHKY